MYGSVLGQLGAVQISVFVLSEVLMVLQSMDILIPDTSALINIHDVYVGPTHIIDVLAQQFDVQVSREIPHEVRRHKNLLGNYAEQMLQFVRQARKNFHREQVYENLIFTESPAGNSERNRGERQNCALALYQARRHERQVIMLIDDMKARRGLIAWYEKRFKTTQPWSSLELLMHLYLVTFPKWPYARAKSALQAVNSRMGGAQGEITKRLRDQSRYLEELHKMLRALPRVKKVLR